MTEEEIDLLKKAWRAEVRRAEVAELAAKDWRELYEEERTQRLVLKREAHKWVNAEASATDANLALGAELVDARQVIERLTGELASVAERQREACAAALDMCSWYRCAHVVRCVSLVTSEKGPAEG